MENMENMEFTNEKEENDIDLYPVDTEPKAGLSTAQKVGVFGTAIVLGTGLTLALGAGVRKIYKTIDHARAYEAEHPELANKDDTPAKKHHFWQRKPAQAPATESSDVVDVDFTPVESKVSSE